MLSEGLSREQGWGEMLAEGPPGLEPREPRGGCQGNPEALGAGPALPASTLRPPRPGRMMELPCCGFPGSEFELVRPTAHSVSE